MRITLLVVALLLTLIFIEGVEHAHLSRGITCELYYIQGQIETVKSLDSVIQEIDNKGNKELTKIVKSLQKYQLHIAKIRGAKQCLSIDHSFTEIIYFRLKNLLSNKQ